MLEYILSKMVMLLFLLLTVAAFVMVKDGLADYFIQQSATQFAKTSVARLSAIVGDSTAMSYKEVIPLPPGISGGGRSMAYEVNIMCRRPASQSGSGSDSTVLVGFAILNPFGKMIAFSATELRNPFGGKIDFNYCLSPDDSNYVALSTKYHYLIISKSGTSGGSLTVDVCPSVDGLQCDCGKKVTC